MTPNDIILGDGAFYIDGGLVALTRGGGTFNVEREYRQIDADGDYGPVKNRIRKIRSVAKLTLNILELVPADLVVIYPALQISSGGGTDTITAKEEVQATDYSDVVEWIGRTLEGRPVHIKVENAINLESIEWPLVDKEEIVPVATYTATYLESARKTEPWSIEYLPVESVSGGLTALAVTDNTPTSVTLTPAFNNAKYSYTGAIAFAKTGVYITPTAALHVIKVNGLTVVSGEVSPLILIDAGDLAVITIIVQEPDKSAVTYELRIFHAAA